MTTNNSSWAPVNPRLAPPTHPPPVPLRNNESPNGYFFAPPVSSPLTHITTPYDYFFSMYDEDIGDHRRSENLLGPNAFQVTRVTRTVAYDSRRPYEGAIVVARPSGFCRLITSSTRFTNSWFAPRESKDERDPRWTMDSSIP